MSLSLLFPFAIYGLNLFNGQMLQCNDSDPSIHKLNDCAGEYNSKLYKWDVLAPRRVANPYYNFDNFGNSLFILFQIVSQEGWTDVMWSAMSANGRGNQPQDYKSQGNAVFFIIFNLLGAVFVLTLFVSVFMRNYTEQTGVAFLTSDQRSWLELRKLLRQISPSKRPSSKSESWLRAWCYRIAVKKHGKWQRFLTAILFLHLLLLVMDFYPEIPIWTRTRGRAYEPLHSATRDVDIVRFHVLGFYRILYRQYHHPDPRSYLEEIQEKFMGSIFNYVCHWHRYHNASCSFKVQ